MTYVEAAELNILVITEYKDDVGLLRVHRHERGREKERCVHERRHDDVAGHHFSHQHADSSGFS